MATTAIEDSNNINNNSPAGLASSSNITTTKQDDDNNHKLENGTTAAEEEVVELSEEEKKKLEEEKRLKEEQEKEAKAMASRARQRKEVINEIFKTEETYLRGIKVLNEHFVKPLQEKFGKKLKTDGNEAELLFQIIDQIVMVNTDLLNQLRKYKTLFDEGRENESKTSIGKIFLELAPYFKMYTQYCNSYEQVFKLLEGIRAKSSKMDKFIIKQECDPTAEGQQMFAFFILPVQRIPRYNLILRELLKNTEPNHPDYDNIVKALDKTTAVTELVNQRIKDDTAKQRAIEIDANHEGIPAELEIITPGRKFVIEGEFPIIMNQKAVQLRKCFLFSDVLIISKNRDSEHSLHRMITAHKKTFKFKTAVWFKSNNMTAMPWVKDVPDTDAIQNAVQIITETETYVLILTGSEEKQKWLKNLNEQIETLKKNDPVLEKMPQARGPELNLFMSTILYNPTPENIPKHVHEYTDLVSWQSYSQSKFDIDQKTLFTALALHSFQGDASKLEMNFKAGDILHIFHAPKDDKWWIGCHEPAKHEENAGMVVGLVPSTHLKRLTRMSKTLARLSGNWAKRKSVAFGEDAQKRSSPNSLSALRRQPSEVQKEDMEFRAFEQQLRNRIEAQQQQQQQQQNEGATRSASMPNTSPILTISTSTGDDAFYTTTSTTDAADSAEHAARIESARHRAASTMVGGGKPRTPQAAAAAAAYSMSPRNFAQQEELFEEVIRIDNDMITDHMRTFLPKWGWKKNEPLTFFSPERPPSATVASSSGSGSSSSPIGGALLSDGSSSSSNNNNNNTNTGSFFSPRRLSDADETSPTGTSNSKRASKVAFKLFGSRRK